MPRKSFWNYENGVLTMLAIIAGLVFLDRLTLTYLLPFVLKDISLTDTQIGLLSSVLALSWATSGYFIGRQSDIGGRRKKLLLVSVVGFSLCTALTGLASSFVLLLVVRAVMGAVEGPVLPLTQSIMAHESSEHRRAFNMGALQNAAGSLLAVMAGPPIMIALAQALGWRASMVLVAIPGLIMAVVLWRYLHEPKREKEHPSDHEPPSEKLSFVALLSCRNIKLCILIGCGLVTCSIVLLTFSALYLVRTKGLLPREMGIVMAMIGLGAFVWGLVVPSLSDRFGRKPVLATFSLIMVAAPLLLVYYAGTAATLAVLILLTFVSAGCNALGLAVVPSESVPHGNVGMALGLIMGLSEIVGGVIAPTAAGVMSDHFGPSLPFFISASGALLASVCSLFLEETAPRRLAALARRSRPSAGPAQHANER